MTPLWLVELSAWAAVGAAIATGASAIVIAIQARYTRESVQASQAAVLVAHETLRESQLARLDANAPRLFLTFSRNSFEDAYAIKGVTRSAATQVAPDDHVFRLPRDKDWKIGCDLSMTIRNDGDRSVQLIVTPGLTVTPKKYPSKILVLGPGISIEGTYKVERSLQEWVDIAKQRAAGNQGHLFIFEASYTGAGDSDVTESHRVSTEGTLVAPVKDEDGAWRVANIFEREMDTSMQPIERTYWKSRKADQRFE